MSKHLHRAASIEYRGKADSVYVTCLCNEVLCVGVWFYKAPPGWAKRPWPLLMQAIDSFLASWHKR